MKKIFRFVSLRLRLRLSLSLSTLTSSLISNIMQFLLIAYDGTDSGALGRRMNVRPGHLDRISVLKKTGEFLFGGAILDESGKMIGSMILYEYPDRSSLDNQLKSEPYITEGVWVKIEIKPFRLAKIE
jgi:uncharacterized protein YciI